MDEWILQPSFQPGKNLQINFAVILKTADSTIFTAVRNLLLKLHHFEIWLRESHFVCSLKVNGDMAVSLPPLLKLSASSISSLFGTIVRVLAF